MWSDKPDEIVNRLGWLDVAARMDEERHCIGALLQDVEQEGYTQALLLGMGGSSLAPEVFARTFGSGALRLRVLDSTHPAAVRSMAESLDLARTLFIVATKSGTTAETLSFFKYFYNRVQDELGGSEAGAHFVAITDAGSTLASFRDDLQLPRGLCQRSQHRRTLFGAFPLWTDTGGAGGGKICGGCCAAPRRR